MTGRSPKVASKVARGPRRSRARSAPAAARSRPPSGLPERRVAPRTRVILVTGMSGAGRSSALKTLEDLGYEAVDNLPISLLSRLVQPTAHAVRQRGATAEQLAAVKPRALAIGVDIRTRDFDVEPFLHEFDHLIDRRGLDVHLLFLDSSDDTLLRRYTETRRRHPLAIDRPVIDGVSHERRMLAPLLARADRVIDTSDLTAADLRRLLEGVYRLGETSRLAICVKSFSYRHGVPREADLVFDVRFLRNPHYVPTLRPLTGMDAKIGGYVAEDPGFDEFYRALTGLLAVLVPRYEQEGKSYLTIAVGCTGGRHRSVYVAERLVEWLRGRGADVAAVHRDILKEDASPTVKPAAPAALTVP